MKIVLDTNCLIQSISTKSPYHSVWLSFEKGDNTLCVSNEIIEEYEEILERLTDSTTSELVIRTIVNSPYVEFITPYFHFNLITADPDDNKFVDCAITANARYIVSNDKHYNILKQIPYPTIDVISIKEFAKLIQKNKN